MFALREREEEQWARAALLFSALIMLLLALDVFVWHPSYAQGDEADIVLFLQRVHEGMPWHWNIDNGSLHKQLLYFAMGAWPGKLWVTSLPGMLALPVEACLLFTLTRKMAGSRAGFFAVFLGLGSAFTLVRARAGLSFCLYPVEWLALLWLRPRCSKPWAALLWGAALGLCTFDYEAWIPGAILMVLLPFFEPPAPRQRAWELVGAGAFFLAYMPWEQLALAIERRRSASLLMGQSKAASAGWDGLRDLILGGRTMPYLAPVESGILPFWLILLFGWGLTAYRQRWWAALIHVGAGCAVVLAGGAPYGLPAHRFVLAWPALILVSALGLEKLWDRVEGSPWRRVLALALVLLCGQQLYRWAWSQEQTDASFRGPVRNMKAAADFAWATSQRTGLPLVTDLHPFKGSQFRFAVGHPVPIVPADAKKVLVFLPWEYLPAVRGSKLSVATFQALPGYAPGLVAVLDGPQARAAVEAERSLRPLLNQLQLFSPASRDLVVQWLKEHPHSGPWARTEALDYVNLTDWHLGRFDFSNIRMLKGERLMSDRSLILAAVGTMEEYPDFCLATLKKAREVDPNNGKVLTLEAEFYTRAGKAKEAQTINAEIEKGAAAGTLFWD